MGCNQLVEGSPGNKVGPFAPDVAVGIAAVVPLPAAPAGVRRVTVQNTTTTAGRTVRVREVGGILGSGFLLDALQSVSFGGSDGAVALLEVEGNALFATTVTQGFEGSLP
jgi:hypothetical protein